MNPVLPAAAGPDGRQPGSDLSEPAPDRSVCPRSKGSDTTVPASKLARSAGRPVRLWRGVSLSALGALLSIAAARQLRGRKLAILCTLFALPVLFAILAQRFQAPYRADDVEAVLIFGLIPQALLPLSALLFASGMVQDDVEEQTLTYLLIRPIPRWLIYVAKVAGTWLVTFLLTSLFTTAALATVYWGTGIFEPLALFQRAAILSGILSLSSLAYIAIFGGLGLLWRKSLILGVSYIIIFEGVLANFDFLVRRATVMYYLRTLSVRLLHLKTDDWAIDPATAPGVATCLLTLAGIGVVLTLAIAWLFSAREFRVKTPDKT
ncbi:MAG: ABC transporter permease [Isosphaeraceae bacterium]